MGEYARRKSDGLQVKIGVCESLYYLRWEQRHQVERLPNSLDPAKEKNLFWRLPFPDEDCFDPGDYDPHDRMEPLFKRSENGMPILFSWPGLEPGRMTVEHESGLTMVIPCHHGDDVPALGEEVRFHWHRKQWAYGLRYIKNVPGRGLCPIIGCRWCGRLYRMEWESVLPFINDPELWERLAAYAEVRL